MYPSMYERIYFICFVSYTGRLLFGDVLLKHAPSSFLPCKTFIKQNAQKHYFSIKKCSLHNDQKGDENGLENTLEMEKHT